MGFLFELRRRILSLPFVMALPPARLVPLDVNDVVDVSHTHTHKKKKKKKKKKSKTKPIALLGLIFIITTV